MDAMRPSTSMLFNDLMRPKDVSIAMKSLFWAAFSPLFEKTYLNPNSHDSVARVYEHETTVR